MYDRFARPEKKGRNNKVTVWQGSTVAQAGLKFIHFFS